jgi:dTDP-4-dehydrorhamnose 3,5-epimerase
VEVQPTNLADVKIILPKIFKAGRGTFFESFNQRAFAKATGYEVTFVQDNHSQSAGGVLRGLHYQLNHPQGKLIRVVSGAIFDVAVDLRKSSPDFGKWVGAELSAANNRQLWVPPGFAHGFLVTSEHADVLYKTTDYYHPENQRCIMWNDPAIGISWPCTKSMQLSRNDQSGSRLQDAVVYD